MSVFFKASFVGEKPFYLAEKESPNYFKLEKINFDPVPVLSTSLLKDILERFPFIPSLPSLHDALDHNYAQLKFLSGKNFLSRMKRLEEDFFRIKKENSRENAAAWLTLQKEFLREIKIEMEALKLIEAERLKSDFHFKEAFSERKQLTKKHLELHLKSLDEAAAWFNRKLEELEDERRLYSKRLTPNSIALSATEVSFQNSGKVSLSAVLSSFPAAEAARMSSILLKANQTLVNSIDSFQPTKDSLARKRESFFDQGLFEKQVLNEKFWSYLSRKAILDQDQAKQPTIHGLFGTNFISSGLKSKKAQFRDSLNLDKTSLNYHSKADFEVSQSASTLSSKAMKPSRYLHQMPIGEYELQQVIGPNPGNAGIPEVGREKESFLGRYGVLLTPSSETFNASIGASLQGANEIRTGIHSAEANLQKTIEQASLQFLSKHSGQKRDLETILREDESLSKVHEFMIRKEPLRILSAEVSVPKSSYSHSAQNLLQQNTASYIGSLSGLTLQAMRPQELGSNKDLSLKQLAFREAASKKESSILDKNHKILKEEFPGLRALERPISPLRKAKIEDLPLEMASELASKLAAGDHGNLNAYEVSKNQDAASLERTFRPIPVDRAKEPSIAKNSDVETTYYHRSADWKEIEGSDESDKEVNEFRALVTKRKLGT